jgi:hypothetical protein
MLCSGPSDFNVSFQDLQVKDLPLLNDSKTLYTFDPRSMLDECLGKHRYIVSCENLLSQLLINQHTVVNQYALKHTTADRNNLFIATITGDPRISLYTRMRGKQLPPEVQQLYVAVPHIEADTFAAENGLKINYTHSDYLKYNNKIVQKELLGDLTPPWKIIDPKTFCFDENADCYFKRENGSGGYAIFHASDLKGMKMPSNKYPSRWYMEEAVQGHPNSIQIFKDINGTYTIFGYSSMKIISRKNYAGGLMRKTGTIPDFVREKTTLALKRLHPLLKDYTGFMGLDFIENEDNLQVLEANIRVTMATFATLQLHDSKQEVLEFYHFR